MSPSSTEQHATPSLVSDLAAVKPGGELMLALRFTIERDWHLYWPGLNDTGLPPTIKLSAPPGYVAGEPLWPAPVRHVSAGDIVDYIYEKELLVLIPVKVPADAAPGGKASFTVASDWLACSRVCVPESGEASLSVAIAGESAPSKQAPELEKAKLSIPRPLSESGGAVVAAVNTGS